jgi:cyanophycinase
MASRTRRKGVLMAIGGKEDKSDRQEILRRFASLMKGNKLVVATVASEVEDEQWEDYRKVFREIGVKSIERLSLNDRGQSLDEKTADLVSGAGGVFFTGGDQIRITSKLGGTDLCNRIREVYLGGGIVGGTSAGASVLTETMLVSGETDGSHQIGASLRMAPGLGLIPATIIDQHFAERGRIGRLIAAVAQNPRALGLGIDENTAVAIHEEKWLEVTGAGAVYVVDGHDITSTNIAEHEENKTISVFGVRLHVLSEGDCLNLETRMPERREQPSVKG